MMRVRTASRLHFGLLSLVSGTAEYWPNRDGEHILPVRLFGGVGLMVEEPRLQLAAKPGAAWSAEGPLANEVLAFAHTFAQSMPTAQRMPHHFIVEYAPFRHQGLGTGTQLALAVAKILANAANLPVRDPSALAQRMGRGRRSALGIHGFAQGGFLVEAGKRQGDTVAPLVVRTPFPESWRIVLTILTDQSGRHGHEEQQAFQHLPSQIPALDRTATLCRLVLLGMLPALVNKDFQTFTAAVHDFNARAGEAFASVQGGTYSSPVIADLIAFLRQLGIKGVGQSSWGPAVFAFVEDPKQGEDLAERIRRHLGPQRANVLCTRASNHGAIVEI